MIQKVNMTNEVWDTPLLPTIPEKIKGAKYSSYALTGEGEDNWEFLFEEIEGLPLPGSLQQDYDFEGVHNRGWEKITVPSSLIMQGYDIKNNTEYYYRKTIMIPRDYADKRVFLRFEGVYSNCRIWVNNRYVNTHVGGFTWWDCDISDFSKESEITLIVGVADLEGKEKGNWNPDGVMVSDSAWASHYAHNNIGGILREVTLYALQNSYIVRTHLETILDENYVNAQLQIDMQIHQADQNLQVKAELLQEDGSIVNFVQESIGEINSLRFAMEVEKPVLWDAEHPNLYSLRITLQKDGELLQENLHTVGFRQICYGGMRGTDRNKMYINGKEIKLHGVCRHDISYDLGRCISKEDAYREILAYKRNNVNHIRTSHYPASRHLLAACDQLGIYVEQENSACFKGANGYGVNCEAKEFVDSFAEMIESSRNHPSVIIWSLGNESDFEATSAFRTQYQYVKECDCTRPIIFSYPDTAKTSPTPYEIYSFHYANVDSDLGYEDMPKLHDEFAHVACYNHAELIKDNSVRDFWGESLKRGWDNIFCTEGALGCAIWGGIDEVFYLPEGTKESHQHHAPGKAAGYGEWGAILDVYKREKPEAYLTKKAYSPIRVIEEKCNYGEDTQLYLCNRFDHACLSEIQLICLDKTGEELYNSKLPAEIGPHEEGTVLLAGLNTKNTVVKLRFFFGEIMVEECLIGMGEKEEKVQSISFEPFVEMEDENDRIILRGKNASLHVNRITGGVDFLASNGTLYAKSGNLRHNGELQEVRESVSVHCRIFENKLAEITVEETFANQLVSETQYAFDGNSCHAEVKVLTPEEEEKKIEALSLELPLLQETESVKFQRNGLYSTYPEGHIGRNVGTAYKRRKGCKQNPDRYGVKPNWNWEQDMANYFLFQNSSAVTNDFRTKRTHISDYTVVFTDSMQLCVKPEDCDLAAFVMQSTNDDSYQEILELSLGSYYKTLEWGNYCGEVPEAGNEARIAFVWSLTDGERE